MELPGCSEQILRWGCAHALAIEDHHTIRSGDILPKEFRYAIYYQVIENERRVINNEDVIAELFGDILRIDMENIVIGHIMINVMEMKKAGYVEKHNIYNLFQYTKFTFINCRSKSFKEVQGKIANL